MITNLALQPLADATVIQREHYISIITTNPLLAIKGFLHFQLLLDKIIENPTEFLITQSFRMDPPSTRSGLRKARAAHILICSLTSWSFSAVTGETKFQYFPPQTLHIKNIHL